MGYLISIRALISFLLPIIISSLLIPTAMSDDNPLLNKICTNTSQNYTETSNYAKNLKNLLTDLFKHAPSNHGFRNISLGLGSDRAYGLALCRGDASTEDCEDCLYDARCKITRRCNKREAIVWYDYCNVKYSDNDFFGEIDTRNKFILVNVKNASDPRRFNATAIGLLSELSRNASDATNKYMFARGERLFDKVENVTIYGMAQCSRDLSRGDCKKCLHGAVEGLPIYKGEFNSVGGRVVGASCTVRYEIYTFLNDPPKVSIS